MKKTIKILLLCMVMTVANTQKSHAVWFIVNAAVKKVLKAINLQVQRQQNKVIWLQNAQKTIENTMSKARLGEIGDWTKKQRDQYQKYYQELQKVKTVITYYKRIKSIGEKQAKLLRAYRNAWELVKRDNHFSKQEVEYAGKVYGGILNASVENLDQILLILNSFQTQMSDAKRMELIDQAADQIDINYTDLLKFIRQNATLSLNRSTTQLEVNSVKRLYGLM